MEIGKRLVCMSVFVVDVSVVLCACVSARARASQSVWLLRRRRLLLLLLLLLTKVNLLLAFGHSRFTIVSKRVPLESSNDLVAS